MKIEFIGHSCFVLEDAGIRIMIDPFITGNPLAKMTVEEIKADYIFITHGHGDHIGDTVDIAMRTGATVYAVVEVADGLLADKGIKTAVGNIGGRQKTPFGSVKFLPASHGSGVAGGLACGFLFEIGNKKIYHAGDTALISDMQLLAEEHIDVALLPIGDFYTMGPEDAVRAAKFIAPKMVIPMHYNTFQVIEQDPEEFKKKVEDKQISKVEILSPGQIIELE